MANYGRALEGTPDALIGYRLEAIEIDDPDVVRVSGKAIHAIARATGDPSDRVKGTVFELTEAELASTDRYETSAYSRIEVVLDSGVSAWAYVALATSAL